MAAITIEKFQALFPKSPFALHYVERGSGADRAFGWHASFTSAYWTSDTDRPVYDHQPPRFEGGSFIEGWGSTPEEALAELVEGFVNNLRSATLSARKFLHEREDRLRLLTRCLEEHGVKP